jgi:hypothetical protein
VTGTNAERGDETMKAIKEIKVGRMTVAFDGTDWDVLDGDGDMIDSCGSKSEAVASAKEYERQAREEDAEEAQEEAREEIRGLLDDADAETLAAVLALLKK